MQLYVVGGAIRDLLLGREGRIGADRDFAVAGATPEEFLHAFPKARLVGKSFQVALLDGREYCFLQSDDGPEDAQGAVRNDLYRRDLTINALAMDLSGALYAHPQALQDLRDGILRPATDSALSDDPVRVFRAARFAATMPDFSPDPSLVQAMRRTAAEGSLAGQPAERVGREILKAAAGPAPSRFVRLLRDGGCLRPWFTELAEGEHVPAGPPQYHDKDVLGHTMEVMDRLAGDPLLVWMGLCHDLGKAATPSDGWPRHPGHDIKGVDLARRLGERLALPTRYIEAGMVAARRHMTAARYDTLRPGTRVDLLLSLHQKRLIPPLFALSVADHGIQDRSLLESAQDDLDTVLSIRLPEQDRDRGRHSFDTLRRLRCEALARKRGPGHGRNADDGEESDKQTR